MYFKRLKDLRIDNDYLQKDIAKVLGISQGCSRTILQTCRGIYKTYKGYIWKKSDLMNWI